MSTNWLQQLLIGNEFGVANSSNGSSVQCNTGRSGNHTVFTDEYMGIPENLLINVIAWLLLLLLFTILRKSAWNYGRLALVQKK